jgi:hypothetical protein
LISEQGAAHIVANELGVKLIDMSNLQVKNILVGMRNVEVTGKVVRTYELREFETENRKGKVGSMLIADDTGMIRDVLWNEQADLLQNVRQDDIIKIQSAYVRDNQGRKELHLNERSKVIINPEGVTVKTSAEPERKKLQDVSADDQNLEVLATIVQVYEPRFFEICPECGKRLRLQDGSFVCDAHQKVTPSYGYVMNLFLDDGTGNIRTVLWRRQVQSLLNLTNEQVLKFREDPVSFEPLKNELLGNMVKVVGRIKKNEAFDSLELVPNRVIRNPDPEEELKKIKQALPESKEDVPVASEQKEESEESEQQDVAKPEDPPAKESLAEPKNEPAEELAEQEAEPKSEEEDLDLSKELDLEEELVSIDDLEEIDKQNAK